MKYLILLCFIAGTTVCYAQNWSPELQQKFIRAIISRQSPTPAAKGTSIIAERLIASAKRFLYETADSTRYKYSNGRGSRLDNNDVEGTYLELSYSAIQVPFYNWPMDINYGLPNIMFDTARYYRPYEQDRFIYSRQYNTNAITEIHDEYSPHANQYHSIYKNEFTFNGAGQLIHELSYTDTSAVLGGDYKLTEALHHTYIGNRLILDSFYDNRYPASAPTTSYCQYNYDSNGNLIALGSPGATQPFCVFTYDTDNLLVTAVNARETDSFQYDAAKRLVYHTLLEQLFPQVTLLRTIRYHYDSYGRLVRKVSTDQYTNSMQRGEVFTYSYNGFNHIDTMTSYYPDTAGHFQEQYHTVFYYEQFLPLDATPIVKSADLATIYPIPATEVLHVQLKIQPGTPVTAGIYNQAGQLVLAADQLGQMNNQIPVAGLVPGNYILRLATSGSVQSIPFIRQ